MRIGSHDVDAKVLIVAEIGNNHEGSFERATQMVESAAASGVDAVKFQTFRTKYFSSGADPERFKRLSSFELTYDQFAALEKLARKLGLIFISTPLDLESARFLQPLVDAFKIASGDNDFYALIDFVCSAGKPVVISSGLTDLAAIKKTRDFAAARLGGRPLRDALAILHCTSSYPAPPEQANLRVIPTFVDALGCTIGYSDHTMGVEACLGAVALGARILEKHFTLDKNLSDFRDHKLSADPNEMSRLVREVRTMEQLLGSPDKKRQAAEASIEPLARRSIVAAADLVAGHAITLSELTWIRPAGGLPPGDEAKLVGKKLKRDVRFGEKLTPADVE